MIRWFPLFPAVIMFILAAILYHINTVERLKDRNTLLIEECEAELPREHSCEIVAIPKFGKNSS